MQIVLIFPKVDPRHGTKIKNYMIPPYGLQLIAALTPKHHKVIILDQFHQSIDLNLTADLVGISVWTASAVNAYFLADTFRLRGIPVVLGGPHVNVEPDEASSHANAIVLGEAEDVWKELLLDVEQKSLKPIYLGKSLPLTESPYARWDVIRNEDYVLQNSISTSRGCYFNCEFCYESSREKNVYRRKPINQVLEEIDQRPSSIIAFLDNDLLIDKRYSRPFLHELSLRKKHWMAMTTIRFADDLEMVKLAADAGCRTLFIGFESVSNHSLHDVNKRQNKVEMYQRNIQRLHDHNIMINGSFVFGFDSDTVDIFDFDWGHYDTTHVVFRPKQMSSDELEEGYLYAYKKFYEMRGIFSRSFRPGKGLAKRLALNFAYKRIEPLWNLLDLGISARWARYPTEWYMKP